MAKPTRYTEELITEYMKKGHVTAETLGDSWDQNAREYPDKEAVADSKRGTGTRTKTTPQVI